MSHIRRLVATPLFLLGAFAAAAGAQSLGTPKSPEVAKSMAEATARKKKDADFATSIGVLPFASLLNGDLPARITMQLSGIATSAFTGTSGWHVRDQAAEPTIEQAMKKVQSAGEFESAVRVEQGRWTSTRYLLAGLLQDARDTPGTTKDGKATHDITLEYRVRVFDVQTKETVLDSSIRVTSTDLIRSKEGMKDALARSGAKSLLDAFNNKLKRNNKVQKDDGVASNTFSGAVNAATVDEALERALKVAEARFTSFAASAMTIAARSGGEP
jgi:hypothetical protein